MVSLNVNAYLLAADPAWIEASVLSYYDLTDRIVVSFDERGASWTGSEIPVENCLERLRRIDGQAKLVYAPGHFSRLDHDPIDNDTYQRQCALDLASEGADWVLQIDTDEVLSRPSTFAGCLESAHARGLGGLEFPARYVYAYAGEGRYLEMCDRLWRTCGTYPGPVAVRAGTRLRFSRQAEIPLYRVDFRARNTDPAHPRNAVVSEVINRSDGIVHYTRVRSEQQMRSKAESNGHRYDWDRLTQQWLWRQRHPHLTSTLTPFRLRNWHARLRITRDLPPVPEGSLDLEALGQRERSYTHRTVAGLPTAHRSAS